MMPEPTQVASLGQDGHGVDRADTRNGRQQLIVRQVGEKHDGSSFNLIASPDQASPLSENETKHADGIGIRVDGKSNRTSRRRRSI